MFTSRPTHLIAKAAAGLAAAAGVLLLPAAALADAPVTAPAVPGVAGLPGPLAPAYTAAPSLGVLTTKPDIGVAGKSMTITGSGVAAGKTVTIEWMTANVRWTLDARPDSVDYTGRKVDKLGVVLGTTTADANGAFSIQLKTPRDFGGLHDLFAVVDGQQVAKGGYLIQRQMSISPTKGPIGTPITIHYTGLGSPLYDSGAAIYYDNRYTGVFTANTTRGDATFVIRAAGPVGKHQIVSGPAITIDYLNPQQSPQPWQSLFSKTFTVTRDAGVPKPQVDQPADVSPTLDAKTTLAAATGSVATAQLSQTSGTVLSKVNLTASGLVGGQPAQLAWSTVVGNRVNCTGTCWALSTIPLTGATVAANGTLSTPVTIPDNLGGWHMIQVLQGGQVRAQAPFFVNRSLVGVSPQVVHAGDRFTVHLKGVGWTQLDNTAAVTYDNSYVGYGCGFNSNGDVVLNLVASGGPGTHLIDLYPMLYTQNPPYLNAVYGMVPYLSYAQDAPGLALGYKLPAIRLAITVVK